MEVLHALDVDEGGEAAVVVLDQAAGDAGHGGGDGYAGVHQGRGGPQIEPWEVEPLEESASLTTRMA